MSETEIVLKAEIAKDKIVFRSGEKLIKEMSYPDRFYLGIPIQEIIQSGDLKPGKTFTFPVLDPISYSIRDSTFEVFGMEDILILGKKMRLRHVRTQLESIIPVVMEEWIDEEGNIWKSISQASFMTTTSIRMPKDKALEMAAENLDIAFSTIIPSNVLFDDPLEVKEVTFKLSGIPVEKLQGFPFDGHSQFLLESQGDFVLIRTTSQVFEEEKSLMRPIVGEEFQEELKSTTFCQSDDPGIVATAKDVVGEEKNAWRAAKKIARWVEQEMTANYDVGFATASEIMKNREGDCSEHTVIMVALCRAAGIPARAAVGLMYADGIFAYHMWPEVYVGQWVNLDAKWLAVDQKTGEFYTDATHIKLGRSNLDENIFEEMMTAVAGIIGKIDLEIVDFSLKE
jgi:transglutaminase-like putative cysteine protease